MFDDFTPATDLERAFAQATGWEIDKLWKEADRNGDREEWSRFLGQSSCLAYQCAVAGRRAHLNTIITAMLSCIDRLTGAERHSLFRVFACVVYELREQGVTLESVEMRLVLRVPCAVLRNTERRSIAFLNMLSRLTTILGRHLETDDLDKLAECCEKTAVETGLLAPGALEEQRRQSFLRQIP